MIAKQKTYCVHVYPRHYEYENIKASSPEEAEMKVLNREWPDGLEYSNVEVMVQCNSCGLDNDLANTNCDECGEEL